jgi:hypothetical protein
VKRDFKLYNYNYIRNDNLTQIVSIAQDFGKDNYNLYLQNYIFINDNSIVYSNGNYHIIFLMFHNIIIFILKILNKK